MRQEKEQNAVIYEASVNEDRELWRLERPQLCQCCGEFSSWPPLAVHEIERRSHAVKCWGDRCNYLLLCERCHAGPFATMPHADQLAVKLITDPSHFNLERWLRLKDPELRAPNRVTLEMVQLAVARFRQARKFAWIQY